MIRKNPFLMSVILLGGCTTIAGPDHIVPKNAPVISESARLSVNNNGTVQSDILGCGSIDDQNCRDLNDNYVAAYNAEHPSGNGQEKSGAADAEMHQANSASNANSSAKAPVKSALFKFVSFGLQYQELKCENYLHDVLEYDTYNSTAGDLATNLGASVTAIFALTNPDAFETKLAGALTGSAAALDSVYSSEFLFDKNDKYQLKQAVQQAFSKYQADTINALDANTTFVSAYSQVYDSYDQCTWPRIRSLVSEALQKKAELDKRSAPDAAQLRSNAATAVRKLQAADKPKLDKEVQALGLTTGALDIEKNAVVAWLKDSLTTDADVNNLTASLK
jgi:hypothetical protein